MDCAKVRAVSSSKTIELDVERNKLIIKTMQHLPQLLGGQINAERVSEWSPVTNELDLAHRCREPQRVSEVRPKAHNACPRAKENIMFEF